MKHEISEQTKILVSKMVFESGNIESNKTWLSCAVKNFKRVKAWVTTTIKMREIVYM